MTDEYFKSYENLEVHRLMLEDEPRTNTYREAICNSQGYFKDKTVMDVGAGTGILSLFCAKAGAKKVYAVEASGLGDILPQVFEANDFSQVIEVLHSKVEDITLDIQVDVIVSEWMGFYLLHESMLDSVLYARDKFLKPGGKMFPDTAQLFATPCTCPDLWQKARKFWLEPKYEFDLSPVLLAAVSQCAPEVFTVPSDGLLADPQLLLNINLNTIKSEDLNSLKDRRFFSAESGGQFHGVAFWFTCTFPSEDDTEDPTELSTAPWEDETHWKQTVILMPTDIVVEEGDILGWEIELNRENTSSRSYQISLKMLGDEETHPIPCSCGMAKCEIIAHLVSNENPAASAGDQPQARESIGSN